MLSVSREGPCPLEPTIALGKTNWVERVGFSDFMLMPNAAEVGYCEDGTACTVSLRWPFTRSSFKNVGREGMDVSEV